MSDQNWCDDERSLGYISYRHKRSNEPTTSVNNFVKEIAKDIDSYKHRLLWNEVQHVNYDYETLLISDIEVSEQEGLSSNQDIAEVNADCMDTLVKNQTAYT